MDSNDAQLQQTGTVDANAWRRAADAVRWNVQPFINGAYQESKSDETFANVNPATEVSLGDVAVGDPRDVDEAVRVARERFSDGSWSQLPAGRRGEILFKLADLIIEHRDDLALLDSLEMGKPITAARFDAEVFAPMLLRSWAGFADKLQGATAPLLPDALSINVFEPRGVIGAITPWNFPSVNAVYKFGPALAAGNTVVLKPSELSPSSALKIAELALEAGMPEGVLNVVPGLGSTVGSALASHPDIDLVSFTGSTRTGRQVMEAAARSNGKPVMLECGGKSPHVVFGDVDDVDAVADAAIQAVLFNQGQVCAATTRLLVAEDVAELLLEKVVSRAAEHRPGDPLDEATTFGPLASSVQRDRVRSYIDDGVRAGARVVVGGHVQEAGGCFVEPTIFDRVDHGMKIVREEIFGPVLCVQTFKTEQEAIELANATEYGLVATVWTGDLGRSMRLAHAVRAGYVAIRNSARPPHFDFTLSDEPQKSSGFGSELGLRGLESYSTLKAITFS